MLLAAPNSFDEDVNNIKYNLECDVIQLPLNNTRMFLIFLISF
jgi:hypothetical protein